jgi:hypothetical protein
MVKGTAALGHMNFSRRSPKALGNVRRTIPATIGQAAQ